MKCNKLVMLLPFIVLLIVGCSSKKNTDLADQIDCDKTCNDKADKALADYENCRSPYNETYKAAIKICEHVAPANKVQCMISAIDNYTADSEKCFNEYKEKLEEVKKCRADCRSRLMVNGQ